MLTTLEARIDAADKALIACEVLAEEHLKAAAPLATEAVKQGKPGFTEPLTALAFYYLLSGKWLEYADVMESVRAAERNTVMLQYLNAMERLQRFTLREQAKLVLAQDDVDAAYAEFQKLKTVKLAGSKPRVPERSAERDALAVPLEPTRETHHTGV